jgi:hypothetical protein
MRVRPSKYEPFAGDRFSETNACNYLKNPCEDPPRMQSRTAERDGGDGRPGERQDARNDSDQAFDQ